MLLDLAVRDFRSRYLGSYLGTLWVFINPLVYIFILWFVFQVGFKSNPVDKYPYVIWLVCGLIPWFFFSDCLTNSANAIIDNSYLVKKMVFRVGMLPLIKILSCLFVHIIFILILSFVYIIYGNPISIYYIQIFYYLAGAIILIMGISFITSSLVVFVRDLGQVIGILLQFMLWLSPIFWPANIMPKKYLIFIKLNPLFYLVEGYRSCFIYEYWFWQRPVFTIYFWVSTLAIFFIGMKIFMRLKPHFADVL